MIKLPQSVTAVAAALAVVLVGGVAAAAKIPGNDGVIHTCRDKRSGDLRAVDSAKECRSKKEVPLDWNQAGPQGPPGPTTRVFFKEPTVAPVALKAGKDVSVRSLPLRPGRYSVDALVTVSSIAAQPINIFCSVRATSGSVEHPSGNSDSVGPGMRTTVVIQGIVETRDVLPDDGAWIQCSVQPTQTAAAGAHLASAGSWIRATQITEATLVGD